MKDFKHPHVLGLLGVCLDTPDAAPYIVLPFMSNGSVKEYLKRKRTHVLDVESIPKVYILLKELLDLKFCSFCRTYLWRFWFRYVQTLLQE